MRVLALLAVRNEARFISGCLENLDHQGVNVYLIDNGSTDDTKRAASAFLGRNLIGVEDFPFDGVYRWAALLRRKQELALELDADWFIHADADERHLPPAGASTIAEALAQADRAGFNAVNFKELTFVPTAEHPDHDNDDFEKTLRSYYPFEPIYPHRVCCWRKQPGPVDLVSSGGHRVKFTGLWLSPVQFFMKHYLFLGLSHLQAKYGTRIFDPAELENGWHGWRNKLKVSGLILPSQSELREFTTDEAIDYSNPRRRHWIEDAMGLCR